MCLSLPNRSCIKVGQVLYQPKHSAEDHTFHYSREYPTLVGTSVLVHQQMRTMSIVNFLHHFGVSVDDTCILCIETQLAQAVLNQSTDHGVYFHSRLVRNNLISFIFFSADNSDFSEDTADCKTLCTLQQLPFVNTPPH
jgi:hypothetical protein